MTLNAISDSDTSKVGIRAIDLAKLQQTKYKIAPCFVIPNIYLEEFLVQSGIDAKLRKLVESVSVSSNGNYDAVLSEIRKLFRETSISEEYEEHLREAYSSLSISANFENAQDLLREEEPFVNLIASPDYVVDFESSQGIYLYIKGFRSFINSIKSVWLSLYSREAIEYRRKKGITKFKTGIVVQKALFPDVSAETITSRGLNSFEILVKGYKGLLDITNTSTKDEYSVSREFLKVQSAKILKQEFALLPTEKSGILLKKPLGIVGAEQKLSDVQIAEVARIAKRTNLLLGFDSRNMYVIFKGEIFIFVVNRKGSQIEERNTLRDAQDSQVESDDSINMSENNHLKTEKKESQNDEYVINLKDEEKNQNEENSSEDSEDVIINISEEPEEPENLNSVDEYNTESSELKKEELGFKPMESAKPSETNVEIYEDESSVTIGASKEQKKEDSSDDLLIKDIFEEGSSNKEKSEVYESQEIKSEITEEDDFIMSVSDEKNVSERKQGSEDVLFYIGLIEDLEKQINQRTYELYREQFGDEPVNAEDALVRLKNESQIKEIQSINELEKMKKSMLNGEVPNLQVFNEVTEAVKKFLYG